MSLNGIVLTMSSLIVSTLLLHVPLNLTSFINNSLVNIKMNLSKVDGYMLGSATKLLIIQSN